MNGVPPPLNTSPTDSPVLASARRWRIPALAIPTLRDLRFAGFVALLLAISPTTGSARIWSSALLGGIGGLGFLAARLRRRALEVAVPDPARALAMPPPRVWIALAALALACAPTLGWLFEEYTDRVWRNAHGILLPVFMALLARSALRRDAGGPAEASAWGFAFLAPGLALVVLDAGVRSHYLSVIGLLLLLPGLSLLFLGARRTRLIAVPLALSIFAIPTPEAMSDPLGLTEATSAIAARLVHALGVPAIRHGTAFVLSDGGVLSVSQNCSGLSALHAAAALSLVLAYAARSWPHRILILLLPYHPHAGRERAAAGRAGRGHRPDRRRVPRHGVPRSVRDRRAVDRSGRPVALLGSPRGARGTLVIAVSQRFAPAVAALALLTSVPTVWHAFAAPVSDSCLDARAFFEAESIAGGRVSGRDRGTGDPNGTRWLEGTIASGSARVGALRFRIYRTFEPVDLYGSSAVRGLDASFPSSEATVLEELDVDGVRLPVHWLSDRFGPNLRVRAHAFIHDGAPVAHPFTPGIAGALPQLLSGTRPVTLLLVQGVSGVEAGAEMERSIRAWLGAAWRHYRRSCGEP